jgi:hypothetical protein
LAGLVFLLLNKVSLLGPFQTSRTVHLLPKPEPRAQAKSIFTVFSKSRSILLAKPLLTGGQKGKAMDKYDIVFKGEVMPNLEVERVKAALSRIFNCNEERIAKLFGGGPKTLKSGLDREAAEKYRDVLRNAGAIVYLRRGGLPERPQGSLKASPTKDELSMAPMEGNLVKNEERATIEAVQIDTSAIALAPFSDKPLQPPSQTIPATIPTTAELSIAEPGADLLPNPRPETKPAPARSSNLSLAPLGTAAPPKEIVNSQPPTTGHLQVEPQGEVLKPHEKPTPSTAPVLPSSSFELQPRD